MTNKVIEGLKPAPGTARLVLSRWIVAILGALPGILVGQSAIGKVLGRQPWLTEAPDPLPIVQLGVLTGDMPPAMMGALAVGVLLAWLANQMLTAGAIEILDPNRPAGELRIWRKVIDTGSQFLLPFLRISLLALILGGAGTVLIGKIFRMIKDHGEVARWTGETMIFTLGITRFLLVLAWVALVGALSWWCKVILVADERRFVRRMAAVLPRAAWRRPVQGVLIHWFLGIASVLLAGLVLAFWRQSAGSGLPWFFLWLVVLLAQAYVWHWRLRIYGMLWADPELADLRERPDEPWHVFRKLHARFRRRWPAASRSDDFESEPRPLLVAAEANPEVADSVPSSDLSDAPVEAEEL